MSTILVGICDKHRLMMSGIASLLADSDSIEVAFMCDDHQKLTETLKATPVHVLIFNIHALDVSVVNLLNDLRLNYMKVKTLIVSVDNSEEMILKTIKAGAKGFLANDTDKNDLVEAIYTLRNGFDYFSKSIAHILVNRYVTGIKKGDRIMRPTVQNLSARQMEILKLWGENYSNKEIAEKLFISLRTVETHKTHIMQKFNLKTTVDMVKFGIRNNLIEI
jgi:two-component system response regulator NreC